MSRIMEHEGELVGISPHRGQERVLDSEAETRVVVHGRQWGGSTLVGMAAIDYLLENRESIGWIFAPSRRMVDVVFSHVHSMYPDAAVDHESPKTVWFPNGSVIRFFGSEDILTIGEERGRGEYPEFIGLDATSGIGRDSLDHLEFADWYTDAEKRVIVGTPMGYAKPTYDGEKFYPGSWLYDTFKCGFFVGTDVDSWHFRSSDCPVIDTAALEEQYEMLGDVKAEQEYESRWMGSEDEGDG